MDESRYDNSFWDPTLAPIATRNISRDVIYMIHKLKIVQQTWNLGMLLDRVIALIVTFRLSAD